MFTEETSTKLLTALIWHGLGRSISLAYLPIKKDYGKENSPNSLFQSIQCRHFLSFAKTP